MKNKDNPIDFSQQSIKKAVLRKAIDHPLTIYPLALSVIGGVAAFLLADASILFSFIAGGCAAVGALSFGINKIFRTDSLARQHTEFLHTMLRKSIEEVLHSLEDDLQKFECVQGVLQLSSLREKFLNLEEVLKKRMSEGEISYGRYLGTAEQVYKGAVDNLRTVAVAYQSISTIDSEAIKKQLASLRSNTAEHKTEIQALNKRLELFDEMNTKIESLLSQNEEAMTALDDTAVALANIETGGQATMTVEDAMAGLAELAKRAQQYNSN